MRGMKYCEHNYPECSECPACALALAREEIQGLREENARRVAANAELSAGVTDAVRVSLRVVELEKEIERLRAENARLRAALADARGALELGGGNE